MCRLSSVFFVLLALTSLARAQVFVDPSGSDSNDCLAATVGNGHGPCLTIQHGIDTAYNIGSSGGPLYIQIAAGTFSAGGNFVGPLRGGSGSFFWIYGAGSTQTIINDNSANCGVFTVARYAAVVIQGMQLNKLGGCSAIGAGNLLYGQLFANIGVYNDIQFGTIAGGDGSAIAGESGATFEFGASGHHWIGGPPCYCVLTYDAFFNLVAGAQVLQDGATIECGAPLHLSTAFTVVGVNALLNSLGGGFTNCEGSTFGPYYNVYLNGTINVPADNYFPGNAPGTTRTGGQFNQP